MMRIITGSARGARLETLDGEEITRPTPERIKEAVFNMLAFDLEGRRVLDLFAGSGQMGLEALSRGAASAVFCDSNKPAVEVIKRNAQKTKLAPQARIVHSDYKAFIRSAEGKEQFDIIILDPPYASNMVQDAIDRILRAGIASERAIFVCESDKPASFKGEGLTLHRHNRYGRIYITVLLRGEESEEDAE
ncbi:MAG: 16S rRNA (guanine(966)-N(2))-methyltransferase RsmD [Clostridia bacterium]|nr:16S rRNA (guanine(966)-N(2))-methyltransferase RsmD [Clostridia bacterium]MBQ8382086.1 16S rRNA (guanine(966)-N(2))-methyltransferase RsmD [Clostridia bacterium]